MSKKSRILIPVGSIVLFLALVMYSNYSLEKTTTPVPPSELALVTDPCVRSQINDWLSSEKEQILSVYAFEYFKYNCTPEAKAKQANLPEKLKFTEQLNAMKRSEP